MKMVTYNRRHAAIERRPVGATKPCIVAFSNGANEKSCAPSWSIWRMSCAIEVPLMSASASSMRPLVGHEVELRVTGNAIEVLFRHQCVASHAFILTAALDLAKNQIFYFFSEHNTDETIRLVEGLRECYATYGKLHLSRDSAPWHRSRATQGAIDAAE
jgi:hypothetical protein